MKCTCEMYELGLKPGGRVCEAHFKWAEENCLLVREECAKIADAKAEEFLSPEYAVGQPLSSFSERFACAQVARSIRESALHREETAISAGKFHTV